MSIMGRMNGDLIVPMQVKVMKKAITAKTPKVVNAPASRSLSKRLNVSTKQESGKEEKERKIKRQTQRRISETHSTNRQKMLNRSPNWRRPLVYHCSQIIYMRYLNHMYLVL